MRQRGNRGRPGQTPRFALFSGRNGSPHSPESSLPRRLLRRSRSQVPWRPQTISQASGQCYKKPAFSLLRAARRDNDSMVVNEPKTPSLRRALPSTQISEWRFRWRNHVVYPCAARRMSVGMARKLTSSRHSD